MSGTIHYHLSPDGKTLIPDAGGTPLKLTPLANTPTAPPAEAWQDLTTGQWHSGAPPQGFVGKVLNGAAAAAALNVVAGAQSAATKAIDWTTGLSTIFSDLLSVNFWERVGILLLGIVLVWIGLHMMGRASGSPIPPVPKPPIVPIPV